MIPALWLDLINARDPNTPSPAMSPTFPEGPFPMNLHACKTVGGVFNYSCHIYSIINETQFSRILAHSFPFLH